MDNNTLVLWIAWNSDQEIPFPFMAPYGFSRAQACEAAEEIYQTDSFVTVQTAYTPFPTVQCARVAPNSIESLRCNFCNDVPFWKQENEINGETSNIHLWLECKCGMRTISKEVSYNREHHEQELIKIFSNYGTAK